MNQQPAEQDSPRYRAHPPTSASDCRLVDETLDEYMLGVADPSQRDAVERHLFRCRPCSELIASYHQTVAALALAVPLATPPVSARTALLTRIAATPQSAAPVASVFSGRLDAFKTPTLPSSALGVTSAVLAPSQMASPSAWWKVYAAPLATLPLLLALGLLGAWGFNNYAKLNDANDVIAQQDQTIAALSDYSNPDDQQAMQLAFSQSSLLYNLTSCGPTPSASSWGTMRADPITGQAALQVTGLAAGSYSVLVQPQDGSMVQKATFDVESDGAATIALNLGEAVSDFQSLHIRPNSEITETDVAIDVDVADVLMTALGPGINQNSGTGLQGT